MVKIMKMKYRFTSFLTLCLCIFIAISCCDDEDGNDGINSCAECELEPEVGPCNAAIPRFYFDKKENECKQFIWGGCAGVVPFETLEECEECACGE